VHLFIFNLSTDEDDSLLAFTQEWVFAFRSFCEDITVISTHVGSHSLPKEIEVIEIGGGNFFLRIRGLIRLLKIGFKIISEWKTAIIFHHMSTRTAVILGPLFKLARIKQGLWYSHSNPTKELRFAAHVVDKVFSSSANSLPIRSAKARFVGHGINTTKFKSISENERKQAVLSLGRVSKIKNNEKLIYAVAKSERKCKEIHLAGPLGKSKGYLDELIKLGMKNGVDVVYLGNYDHKLVPNLLTNYSICYTGNPNTVDKSVIEGALCGCFTLAAQEFVLTQTGMSRILKECKVDFNSDLSIQLNQIDSISDSVELRKLLAKTAAEMNDVKKTTLRILNELTKI
jgi:glycosyltransferase involved in cell wall biosynthesis